MIILSPPPWTISSIFLLSTSAAIVISLPYTGPLIWLGWHVPRLYLTWCKLIPKPILQNLLALSLSFSSISAPSALLVSPVAVCLFDSWYHISSPICRNESFPCLSSAPFPLRYLSPLLSSPALLFIPLSYSHPFSHPPPRPVSTTVLLQFMGSLLVRWKDSRGMERDFRERDFGDGRMEGHVIKIY